MSDEILLILRVLLAAIFALAAVGKLQDRAGAKKAMADFGVPESAASSASLGLALAELAVAFGLLFPSVSWYAAIVAALLLAIFTGGMAYQMAKGNAPDCHCFGQLHSEPVNIWSLVRNTVFIVPAVLLVIAGRGAQGPAVAITAHEYFVVAILAALFCAAAAIAGFAKQIIANQEKIIRRVETLELLSGGEPLLERNEAGDPADGLAIGSPFPDFKLPDINGKVVTFDHLFAEGGPMLFMFIGPDCNPCKALFPEFRSWEREFAGRLRFVYISRGGVAENADKFAEGSGIRLLLQKERELANEVYAKWTPTAIFVDANGNIASHTAAGDQAIRELIDKLRKADLSRQHIYFRSNFVKTREPKIGKQIPEFSLKDITGGEVRKSDLIGKRSLVFLLTLTCTYCQDVVKDIKKREAEENGHRPQFIVLADGDSAELAEWGLKSPVLIDKDYKTAVEFGLHGAPAAVLIGEDGTVLSESAVGAPVIWPLIGEKP